MRRRHQSALLLLLLLSLSDHPQRTHCSRQGVQIQAGPEEPPETGPGMPGPGHFPKGAGDGGGTMTWSYHRLNPPSPACIMNDGNLSRTPPSCTARPSDGDQKETGGVYKEGKSAKDQGTSLIFTATLLCILMTHVPLKKKNKNHHPHQFFFLVSQPQSEIPTP